MIPSDPSLQGFPHIWRFSDAEKYTQLSRAEFRRFRPLPEAESLPLWEQYVYPASVRGKRHLMDIRTQQLFFLPDAPSFLSETEDEGGEVVQTLQREISAGDSAELLFFWEPKVAVRTDWRLLLDHWDDFCYPSDQGNLMVLPGIEKVLIYIDDRWYIIGRERTKTVFALNM